jgi:hypothetical protein
VWNANSVKSKKSELTNFLSINNLDIAATSETQLATKHRFPVPGYFVHRPERNQFDGGFMLLVQNSARRGQFLLTTVVNLEPVAVYIFRIIPRLLFVSGYTSNRPDFPILHSDLDSVFSSFDSVVLVGDLNCNITAWNCISVDRNGRMLLSYSVSKKIAINYPDHRTYFHTDFQPSVLDIALSKHCLLAKPLSVPGPYLKFFYVPPFPNLVRFSIICMLTGHFFVPH